jgi:hypothetical protein
MIRIIEHHGITPRAILVAHLFGSWGDMGPINTIAARYNLLVIEDCAQAYPGSQYAIELRRYSLRPSYCHKKWVTHTHVLSVDAARRNTRCCSSKVTN